MKTAEKAKMKQAIKKTKKDKKCKDKEAPGASLVAG